MRTTFKYFITCCILFQIAETQERVLLRIREGKQEAYSMQKGESAKDAIARIENEPAEYVEQATGLFDTLKYYPGVANAPTTVVNTNFGFNHQDVALQWYNPEAGGIVKEFWWRNYPLGGISRKARIRAWFVNEKLSTVPATPQTGAMGYYKDTTDADGFVTPFKPDSGDQWFYKTGDSVKHGFDPLGIEADWLPGGIQVTLDSNVWQGIKLENFGSVFDVNISQLFGFTLSNDTKVNDIDSTDMRMEIGSLSSSGAPYHSYKFYETGRTSFADKGWWLRGDYEWGMYVVIEYTGCRAPKVTVTPLPNTFSTLPRKVCITVNAGCDFDSIANIALRYKFGAASEYSKIIFPCFYDSSCCTQIPGANPGDTVFYSFTVTDVNGKTISTVTKNYRIIVKYRPSLFIYNNAHYSLGTSALIYTNSNPNFDRWSAPSDGITELDMLLSMYDYVILADGSFPSRNVYPAIVKWLASGTAESKKHLFFSSQDYGCYVTESCLDTTFEAGSWEYDYLGIKTLGPQDIPPTNREYRMKPTWNPVTSYLSKWESDSGSTLWYDPTFELAFAGYQDGFVPTAAAETLFTNDNGTIVHGVLVNGETFRTAFFGFDVGALEFRSDTSVSGQDDPKYKWIVDAGSVALSFFDIVESVKPVTEGIVEKFNLGQNYPNPFNPSTTFEYSVPARSVVEIAIYNVIGQKVTTLVNDTHEGGQHRITWNGKDGFGKSAASGIYFYQMKAGSFQSVKKMILLK